MVIKVYRFTADWCQPCKTLAKQLDTEGIEIPNVINVDLPESKELMQHYGIRTVPTIIIDKGSGDFIRMSGVPLTTFNKYSLKAALGMELE